MAVSAGVGILLTEAFPNSLSGQRRKVLWPIRTAIGLEPETDSIVLPRHRHAVGGRRHRRAVDDRPAVGVRRAAALDRAGRHLEADDELALRRLLRDHGEVGLARLLRHPPGQDGRSSRPTVGPPSTYRVEAGTSLASADPIGDPRSWPAAIDAWMDEARGYGWALAAIGASERGARGVPARRDARRQPRRRGRHRRQRVPPQRRRHGAGAPGGVARAAGRLPARACAATARSRADEMATLAELAERWRGDEPERGFSMALGRLGDPADVRCVMATALDATGRCGRCCRSCRGAGAGCRST